ncbi:glutathione S-transferase [Trichoderma chlorosporum]
MATNAIDFYSHREGPNPWKNVILFEELGIPYNATYLTFGAASGGVEHEDFLKKNPAGRVPWIKDPTTGIELTESNLISEYLAEHYDKNGIFSVDGEQNKLLVKQWLGFQAASQGPFFAQAMIAQHVLKNEGSTKHFQGLVKRTITTVDRALSGKEYLVGGKISLADLAYIPWDLALDVILMGDAEAATAEGRQKLWPNWSTWHNRLLERPAVQKALAIQKKVQGKE